MRDAQEEFLPSNGIIKRKSFVGGEEEFVPDIIAVVPCRFTPGFGIWRQVADRYQGITAFTWTAPFGTDIQAGDQIIDPDSRTFEVRAVSIPKDYSTAARALLDLVSG